MHPTRLAEIRHWSESHRRPIGRSEIGEVASEAMGMVDELLAEVEHLQAERVTTRRASDLVTTEQDGLPAR